MAEKITIQPAKIRAYGNIINNKTTEDYDRYESSLVKSLVTINGVPMSAYLLVYSPNNFAFDFDGNLKHLYVSEDEDTVDGFTFDSTSKELSFTSDDVSFGFDDTNKRLYCDNEYHPTSYTVSLNVSSSSVSVGGSVTLSATVLDDQETAVEGATVTFKVGGSLIDTATTNSSGVATLSYTCSVAGSLSFTASCNGANSSSQSVTVNKLSTSTALTSTGSSVTVGTSVTFTATVTSGGSGVNGLTVTFKDGTSTIGTGTTNSSGVSTYTTDSLTEGTHSITAVVTETSTYSTSTSTAVTVTVSSAPTYIFYDACDSSSGLSNYGSIVSLENNSSASLTYNSTENAYAIACTGSGCKVFPITDLNGLDQFKMTMELKMPSRNGVCAGIACINATQHTGVGGVIERGSGLGTNVHFFERNGWKQNDSSTFSTSDYTHYYKLELTVNGYSATWKWYDYQDNLLRTVNKTLNSMSTDFTTLSQRGYGLDIGWNSNSSYPAYIKNILVEPL